MKIFHVNEDNESYIYPILKIFVCTVLIIIFINRKRMIQIDNEVINIVIGVLCTVIGIACIYCVIISAYELSQVHANRVKGTALSDAVIANGKAYAMDEIVPLVENNDIVEVQILSKNRMVKIGASSDCKNGSSKFFDKLYYIDGETFQNIEDFKSGLLSYATDGQIAVISIDGMAPTRFFR